MAQDLRRAERRDPRATRVGLVARAKAMDRADPRDDEAPSPRREREVRRHSPERRGPSRDRSRGIADRTSWRTLPGAAPEDGRAIVSMGSEFAAGVVVTESSQIERLRSRRG